MIYHCYFVLKNNDNKLRSDNEAAPKNHADASAEAAVDEYKAKLAENRRLAREKAEREAAEEEARQKQLKLVVKYVLVCPIFSVFMHVCLPIIPGRDSV
jgi:hypothetical protein